MKKNLILVAFLLCSTIGWTQNFQQGFFESINFEQKKVFGTFRIGNHTIKQTSLDKALWLHDLSDNYPSSWVKKYVSTEIEATSNGKLVKAKGNNAALSVAQRQLLKKVDLSTNIMVTVQYKLENVVTHVWEEHSMNFIRMVMPDVEANYPGGGTAFDLDLTQKINQTFPKIASMQFNQGIVRFVIDQKGKATKVEIHRSCGLSKLDQLLLKSIQDMPAWTPAKDAKGRPVVQKFEFVFGDMTGC